MKSTTFKFPFQFKIVILNLSKLTQIWMIPLWTKQVSQEMLDLHPKEFFQEKMKVESR